MAKGTLRNWTKLGAFGRFRLYLIDSECSTRYSVEWVYGNCQLIPDIFRHWARPVKIGGKNVIFWESLGSYRLHMARLFMAQFGVVDWGVDMRKSLIVALMVLEVTAGGCGVHLQFPIATPSPPPPPPSDTHASLAESQTIQPSGDNDLIALQKRWDAERAAGYIPQIKAGMTQDQVQNEINLGKPPLYLVSSTSANGMLVATFKQYDPVVESDSTGFISVTLVGNGKDAKVRDVSYSGYDWVAWSKGVPDPR